MSRPIVIGALVWAACCAGCGADGGGSPDYIKPTVAVMKFENRAGSHMGWRLGDGMADVLVDRLIATRRFQVIERPDLAAVLKELRLQHSGVTRRHRRAATGRVKNVQYLVKGVVTDFGHVSTGGGFFSGGGWNVFGSGARALMGITLQVVDVESGEIICSESIAKSVRARTVEVKAAYRGVAFGGRSFRRTPLGKATAGVIGKAVGRICGAIAARPWVPKIALVQGADSVVINGGLSRRVCVGAEYDVLQAGAPIVDPDTGDVLGHQPGKLLGRIRIRQVHPRHSVAEVVSGGGSLRVGQRCRPAAVGPPG